MNERHDSSVGARPHGVSRRRFLQLAAAGMAGLLAGCACPQRPAPTPITPVATLPPASQTPAPTEEADEPAEELPVILGRLHWLGHASFRLDGPPVIYFDPVGLGSEPPPADVILISHDHSDHFSIGDLKAVDGPETVIVTIPGIATRLEGSGVAYAEVRAAQPGERVTVGDVQIETVPAYNIGKSYHPKEAGYLGFIVTLEGERLYFAGDTDHIPEMADIECDVALLPIGGTYTMNVEEAAQAAADIGPQVAVPMHDRGADPNVFRDLCDCPVVVMEVE